MLCFLSRHHILLSVSEAPASNDACDTKMVSAIDRDVGPVVSLLLLLIAHFSAFFDKGLPRGMFHVCLGDIGSKAKTIRITKISVVVAGISLRQDGAAPAAMQRIAAFRAYGI